MINEIVIYSDGSVSSFDSDNCQIPSASGSWEILPLIRQWLLEEYPSRLPEECRATNAKIYLGVRKPGGDERIKIPVTHLLRMCKYIKSNEFIPREVRFDENKPE